MIKGAVSGWWAKLRVFLSTVAPWASHWRPQLKLVQNAVSRTLVELGGSLILHLLFANYIGPI